MTEQEAPKKRGRKPKTDDGLVKMVRESDGKTADVHPSMVQEYEAGGFKVCP